MAVREGGESSYERLPKEDPDVAEKKKRKAAGEGRSSDDIGRESSPSGQQEKGKKLMQAPILRFWEFLVGILDNFWRDDRKVVIEKKENIAGRERVALITIGLHRNLQYDKNQKCWKLSLAVKQMEFGIVNSCECSERGAPCEDCKDDKPFIHIVSMCVKPNLPAGAILQNVLSHPWNHPQTVKATSGRNDEFQIPLNPKNSAVTVQSDQATGVEHKQNGLDPAGLPSKGEAITLTWKLSTWETGQALSFISNLLPSSERQLPVDPRHMQVHPESLSEEQVGGEWHITHARKPHLRHMTFNIEVNIHTAVSQKNMLGLGFGVKEGAVLPYERSNLKP